MDLLTYLLIGLVFVGVIIILAVPFIKRKIDKLKEKRIDEFARQQQAMREAAMQTAEKEGLTFNDVDVLLVMLDKKTAYLLSVLDQDKVDNVFVNWNQENIKKIEADMKVIESVDSKKEEIILSEFIFYLEQSKIKIDNDLTPKENINHLLQLEPEKMSNLIANWDQFNDNDRDQELDDDFLDDNVSSKPIVKLLNYLFHIGFVILGIWIIWRGTSDIISGYQIEKDHLEPSLIMIIVGVLIVIVEVAYMIYLNRVNRSKRQNN